MTFKIAPLPYAVGALAPTLSAAAVEVHYERHHKAYLAKLCKLTEGRPEAHASLVELIESAAGELFDNAAQVWNHRFYWECMTPRGGGTPTGPLAARLDAEFGSFARFRAEFTAAANAQFGSGWAWLMQDAMGRLRVESSDDADNPLQRGATPLLALDVWEHAYYLDYRNERSRYVEGFLDHLVSWEFVAANLSAAAASEGHRAAAREITTPARVASAGRDGARGEKA